MSYIKNIIRYIIAPSAEVEFEYTGKGCSVPKDITIVRFHPSVTEVEDKAFEYCKQLSKVIFNEGLQKIGPRAFCGCTSLSNITLPSTVTEIDERAFDNCRNLRVVALNEGLQMIVQYAFCNCTSLSNIALPSTLREIGCVTFYNCRNLREVAINDDLQTVEWSAFLDCRSLKRFTFPTISARLDAIIQTGYWDEIEDKVNEALGVVERRGCELFVSAAEMCWGRNWYRIRESLDNIIRVISYYEIMEGTSIFELALWKFKLDQVDEDNPIPRNKCRMDVPGPVKDIILQYLR